MKVNEQAENQMFRPEIYPNDERPEIYPNDEVDIFDDWGPHTGKPKPDPCCEVHPGFANPANTEYPNCRNDVGQEEITRLKFAVRYLRSAVVSKPFEKCIRHAVDKRYFLRKTSDEHDWVGPYVPCSGPTENDPCFIRNWPSPEYLAYDVIMNTARFGGSTSKRKVSLECSSDGNEGNSMETLDSIAWNYDTAKWNIERIHEITVNRNRVLGDYPNHAFGEEYWTEIFGDVGNDDGCNNLGYSYPVDEIAGMILHEMLHNLKFQHGGSDPLDEVLSDSCNYDSYRCEDLSGSGTCRANSLLEIAEACVSEVVEESLKNCHPEKCCHRFQLPIWVPPDLQSKFHVRHLATSNDHSITDTMAQEYPHDQSELHRVPPGAFYFGSCECESFW
jgi:hypothetical protein